MPFDLAQWRDELRQEVARFAYRPAETLERGETSSVYALLLGSTMLPVVAAYPRDPVSTVGVFISVAGSLGASLMTQLVQGKYGEGSVVSTTAREAQSAELAPAYEAIAKQLNVFPLAAEALTGAGQMGVLEQLRAELKQLHKLDQFLDNTAGIQQTGALNIANTTYTGSTGPIVGAVHSGRDTNIAGALSLNNINDRALSASALRDAAYPPTKLVAQGMPSSAEHLRALIAEHTRRLYVLEVRAARFGSHTPPEIINEIDELQLEISRLQQQLGAGQV